MSLDVYLTRKKWVSYDQGKTHEVEHDELYEANITHNLGEMAQHAGIYESLWRPYRLRSGYIEGVDYDDELNFEESQEIKASEIIPYLENGLAKLKSKPEFFKQFNSPNGWGMYENFVPFVEKYLEACKHHPNAIVQVSR